MIGTVILEGLGMGALLMASCALGIRKGAVNMVHMYHRDVQERCIGSGLITREGIKRNSMKMKAICLPCDLIYLLGCVYGLNGARGFWQGFWQMLVILLILGLVDALLIDEWWVGHTKAWTIPGTEDLKPYIDAQDKRKKGLVRTVGMAILSAVLAGIMTIFFH